MSISRTNCSAGFRQGVETEFRNDLISCAMLILVRAGRMVMRMSDGITLEAGEGEIIAVSGGRTADTWHHPAQQTGRFQSEFIYIADDLVLPNGTASRQNPAVVESKTIIASMEFLECFERCRLALAPASTLPDAIKRHRVAELLLVLRAGGVMLMGSPPRIDCMLISLFNQDLEGEWSVTRALRALAASGQAMSAATLRRRLSEAATSFTALLSEARLAHAMLLLQTTNDQISAVALACGYSSSSRFARRFKSRFGVLPSEIRS